MISLATRRQSESFPDTIVKQRKLFGEINSAIDDAEVIFARHFRAFATAMQSKLPILLGPFAQLSLDEYSDAVDDVLRPELEQLDHELRVTVSLVTRRSMQVGATHGQSLLQSIIVDWDIDTPEVDRFLRGHVLDLAKGLDKTTRERLGVVIRRGVREGQGVAQIQREIMDVAKRMSVERARLIAQTEVLRGFNGGAVSLYEKSGLVRGLRWIDGQDGACALCRSLHGKIIRLTGAFEVTVGETVLSAPYPPIHPGDRCTVSPVLEDVAA